MASTPNLYAARLNVDYPQQLDRVSTLLRLVWIVPIGIIFGLVSAEHSQEIARNSGTISGGLWLATVLMIVVTATAVQFGYLVGSLARLAVGKIDLRGRRAREAAGHVSEAPTRPFPTGLSSIR